MAAWTREFTDYEDLSVSVNLSAKHFSQPNLARKVSEILEDTGVEPRRLKLEITESVIIDNSEAARTAFEELGQLGVELHIDDFGTGYSSLIYLDRYPIESVRSMSTLSVSSRRSAAGSMLAAASAPWMLSSRSACANCRPDRFTLTDRVG
jgi:EAL domain-containing protein (putative c-di-GMP-specific phosphodiesterase class I)